MVSLAASVRDRRAKQESRKAGAELKTRSWGRLGGAVG